LVGDAKEMDVRDLEEFRSGRRSPNEAGAIY
jgi:hypothetical protein